MREVLSFGRIRSGCSGRCGQRVESVQCCGGDLDRGRPAGEIIHGAAGVTGDPPGDRPQSQPHTFRFPTPGWMIDEGQYLGPGDELTRQLHDRQPDPVLIETRATDGSATQ